MWIDLNAAGEFKFDNNYDVCVCGSGPAGITIARRLNKAGVKTLLLEAGGLEISQTSQAVYAGKSVGVTYYGIEACRLRYFGGTSNHWSGMCARFDPIDFEDRGIWGLPGWPIRFEDVYRYEDEARKIVDIDYAPFERPAMPLWRDPRMQPIRKVMSPPTRFGPKYKDELHAAKNLDVALNANVLDVRLDENKRAAREIIVANYAGARFSVTAKFVVIAFGALENARFLLNARSDIDAGLGNQGDFVGRCFMEHLMVPLGRFIGMSSPIWEQGSVGLNPSFDLMRKYGVGNAMLGLNPNAEPRFYGRLAPFKKAWHELTCSSSFLLERARRNELYVCKGDGELTTLIEQAPNPLSRVTLDANARDQFGYPRLVLDWRLSDLDHKTMRILAEELGKAVAAQNIGRVRIASDVIEGAVPALGMHCHHMGTTRMSATPKYGVVDGDCKVHGIENLYIGGSSVYPTGGGCNPTFTIVCLSLRLGDHLANRLQRI